MRAAFPDLTTNECSETGNTGINCSVNLPTTYLALCAETVRDKVGGVYENAEMCDCIIFDPQEEEISLVELKSGTPACELRLLRKAKRQLTNGLCMLLEILQDLDKQRVRVQAVLSSKTQFRSVSMQKEFRKPLNCPVNVGLIRVDCGSDLPNQYTTVPIPQSLL